MSEISQEVIVLNDFGDMRVEERQRTTGAGTSSRYTITFTGEPILHDFAADKLGKGPAEAIAELIRKQIRDVKAKASEATQLKRKYAAAALARGASWATKRYSGGRTTNGAPGSVGGGDALFNDSGRLANSVTVMQNPKEEGFTINVAANRLRPDTFQGGAYERMINLLRQHVPALRGGVEVLQDPTVRAAIDQAQREVIVNIYKQGGAARERAIKLALSKGWQYVLRPLLVG